APAVSSTSETSLPCRAATAARAGPWSGYRARSASAAASGWASQPGIGSVRTLTARSTSPAPTSASPWKRRPASVATGREAAATGREGDMPSIWPASAPARRGPLCLPLGGDSPQVGRHERPDLEVDPLTVNVPGVAEQSLVGEAGLLRHPPGRH